MQLWCQFGRIAQCVFAAEFFGHFYVFNHAKTMFLLVCNASGKETNFAFYAESERLYECFVLVNETLQKRLLIDMALLRQVYEKEVTCLRFLHSVVSAF